MQGRIFLVSSTLHSSTEFRLGGSVYGRTQEFLRSKHPERSDDWITREQMGTLAGWLQTRVMHDASIEDGMYLLS